jgi:integrase/recombinase XerC
MASLYSQTYKSKKTGRTVTYWYVGYIRDGRRRAKCAGTSKSVARELKKRIEAELGLGKFDFLNQPGDVLIGDSVSAYLEQVKALRKYATYRRYRSALAPLLRFMGEKFETVQIVRKLAESHFSEYQTWRRADIISPNGSTTSKIRKYPAFKTINNELSVFRSWLNWAKIAGQISENPLFGVKKLKTTDSRPRRTLTRLEIANLLKASAEIERKRPNRRGQTRLWQFLVSTGLRISEMSHLQWKDVDFRRKVIKVQRKPDWDPKTYGREVPFTPGAERVLLELKGQSDDPDSLVFRAVGGGPIWQNRVREWLIDCAKMAGVKDVHGPHDFRHTFITMALTEFGIDVPTVQKIVGHSRLETTQAYLHPTTDHIASAALKYEL